MSWVHSILFWRSDGRILSRLVLMCGVFAGVASWSVADDDSPFVIIRNRDKIALDQLACERVPLGALDDYKASIAMLPSGELLITMFRGERREDGKIFEQTVLHRSKDGGRTWSRGEALEILGREPSLSVSQRGTVFVTTHLLAQELRNRDGYTHSYIHRSTDAGRTWVSTRVEPEGFRERTTSLISRNVLQLSDGSLMLGISEHEVNCKSFVLRSWDDGETWSEVEEAQFADVPNQYPWTLFGEAHLWQSAAGKILAVLRVGAGNSWPLVGTTDPGENDQSERMVVYETTDAGRRWSKVGDLGTYGQMYMSILRLQTKELLLTYTQRAISLPLGVRAALGRETEDGFSFDLQRDQILLDTKTPPGVKSGGGFGPTVQLEDGTLVTSYTYRRSDGRKLAEVVRWRLPGKDAREE